MRHTEEQASQVKLMNTLSLHRFGLEQYGVDEISCIVQGGGSGYQITGRRQSNSELMYFAGVRMEKILMRTLVHRMKFKTQDIFITSVLQK